MKKKLILFFAMLSLLVVMLAISALAVEVDGIYYSLNGSGETAYATVNTENRSKCKVVDVVIPATIEVDGVTYKVTEIASSAFGAVADPSNNNLFIKTIKIGAYVEKIGNHAFRSLKYLEKVEIDNYLAANPISCSNAEFYESKSLKTVVCTPSSKIKQFGTVCFNGCSSLTSVTFPPSLTSLGGSAFKNCDLREVDLSKTQVTSIPGWCFGGNTNLSVIKFPSALKSIGSNSLQNSIATSIVFPHSLTTISSDAFGHCYQTGVTMCIPALEEDGFDYASGFLHSLVPNVVIYAGNNPELLTSKISKLSNHQIKPFSEYVPGATYEKNTIFYGATTCSTCNGLVGEKEFVFDSFVTEMKEQALCTHCGGGDVTTFAPVLKDLGFSSSEYSYSILHDIAVNYKSLNIYNEKIGDDKQISSYGVLAVLKDNVDESNTAFDNDGNAKNKVKHIDFSSDNYPNFDIWSMKVSGLNPESTTSNNVSYADLEIYICGFIKAGDTVYYINNGASTTLQGATTLNAQAELDK